VVRHQAWLQGYGAQLTQKNLAGSLVQRTINENHRFGSRHFFGHLRCPLVIAEYAHPRIIAPSLFRPLRKKRPDTIIPP
jgi:hypothetical protein